MDKSGKPSAATITAAEARKAKLAEQLRANLMKRKAQARARRAGEADDRDGIEAKPSKP